MIKNIRLHIDSDEADQLEREKQLAEHIQKTKKQNIEAFKRNIPSIVPLATEITAQNISIFCNKWGQYNIVDYGIGRTLYGFHPQQEIQDQVKYYSNHAFKKNCVEELVDKSAKKTRLIEKLAMPCLPKRVPVLIVLGLGIGEHLIELLKNHHIKHLIVYEPEVQYFSCSILGTSWKTIFDLARSHETGIYLQLGKDGRDLIGDLTELRGIINFDHFFCFQHYHHPIFDVIYEDLHARTWEHIVKNGFNFQAKRSSDEYCPTWSTPVDINNLRCLSTDNGLFNRNLEAFKKYYPNIYEQFADYKSVRWLPTKNLDGSTNILNSQNLATWYGPSSKYESKKSFEGFAKYPNKDGLVLGYNGEKLKHYVHYKFVAKTEKVMNEIEEEKGALPSNIKSLIMFGLGVGYQLEELIQNHQVEMLFVCEPNRDFFYASLFSIDWCEILDYFDRNDGRLYLNIGDDGTNLFRDLLNQFYAIGPYVLANTYFYQSYYNSTLNHSISQLREQLQVVISMGEYFDHARYGISHTLESVRRSYGYMRSSPSTLLSYDDKEVPIFFVGNGPSLDYSLEILRENKDKAIIVSCGTSLQVLCKNGIVPDFHAEIEQNRSTFDWAARIGNFEYLKQISLISCNGMHPDTCDLYKEVFLAFKEGESSTVSTLSVLGEESYEVLQFAFPTVTNFAVNFFGKLGFSQHYLVGIDLGFVDIRRHHSGESGYYADDGSQIYDYSQKNNTSLTVPGNFRQSVNTKEEFKIARIILEQSLAIAKADCYNTSDGARISGATPLPIDNVLLVSNAEDKQKSLANMKDNCFITADPKTSISRHHEKFINLNLHEEIRRLLSHLREDIDTVEEAEKLLDSQKTILFASYKNGKSLLFYYLYGTVNYTNAFLAKLLNASRSEKEKVELFRRGLELWIECLQTIQEQIEYNKDDLDSASAIGERRVRPCIARNLAQHKVTVISDSSAFVESFSQQCRWHGAPTDVLFQSDDFDVKRDSEKLTGRFVVIRLKRPQESVRFLNLLKECARNSEGVLLLINEKVTPELIDTLGQYALILQAIDGVIFNNELPYECHEHYIAYTALQFFSIAGSTDFKCIIPKFTVVKEEQLLQVLDCSCWESYFSYDFGWSIGLHERRDAQSDILPSGTRISYLNKGLKMQDCIRLNASAEFNNRIISDLQQFNHLWVDEHYVQR